MKTICFSLIMATAMGSLLAQPVQLTGTWIPTKTCGIRQITMNEDKTAVIELENMTLGENEKLSGMESLVESPTTVTYAVNLEQHPKWITFSVTDVNTGEITQMEGIFMMLSDDRMKMHISLEGKPRPAGFIPVTSPDIVVLDRKSGGSR